MAQTISVNKWDFNSKGRVNRNSKTSCAANAYANTAVARQHSILSPGKHVLERYEGPSARFFCTVIQYVYGRLCAAQSPPLVVKSSLSSFIINSIKINGSLPISGISDLPSSHTVVSVINSSVCTICRLAMSNQNDFLFLADAYGNKEETTPFRPQSHD